MNGFLKSMIKLFVNQKAKRSTVRSVSITFLIQQICSTHTLHDDQVNQMHQMNLQQLQQFVIEQNLLSQMELDRMMMEQQMQDPYQNPGMDVVVDQSFHGIDHHNNSGGFGGGFGGPDF